MGGEVIANLEEKASIAGTCTGQGRKKKTSSHTYIYWQAHPPIPPPTPEPNSTQQHLLNLSVVDLDRVSVGSEHRLAAQGRLGAGTDALEVLGGGQALALGEVGEEEVDVGVEALDLLAVGGQEGEDGHVAVGALVHVPLLAGDGGGREDLGVALGVPAAVVGVSFSLCLF